MDTIDSKHWLDPRVAQLTENYVRVTFVNLWEGVSGDYDPDDPEDTPLLRFDVERWNGFDWEPVEDASYCTTISASPCDHNKECLKELLRTIMDTVGDDVRAGNSIKKKCEGLSWLQ